MEGVIALAVFIAMLVFGVKYRYALARFMNLQLEESDRSLAERLVDTRRQLYDLCEEEKVLEAEIAKRKDADKIREQVDIIESE